MASSTLANTTAFRLAGTFARENALRRRPTHRCFSHTTAQKADFTHTVIGAGAIGLCIARRLQSQQGASVLLLERHRHPGTETSSRNSEVIHAALYYGHGSLKTRLCLQGKQQLYAFCADKGVGHRRCGKWLVAQDDGQMAELEKVHAFAGEVGAGDGPNGLGGSVPRGFRGGGMESERAIPMRWLSRDEITDREPDVRAEKGVLESESTGIVDSHGYMQALLGDFEDAGGTVAFGADVCHIEGLDNGRSGWRVQTRAAAPTAQEQQHTKDGDTDTITTETLINSAGLAAIPISNMILPQNEAREPAYAKGTYYSYSKSRPKPKTLVYPAPVPGHGGLGTHLTLDLAGQIRFGPDVEWLDPSQIDSPDAYSPNHSRIAEALDDIQTYLPSLDRSAVALDYCGIRPKLRRGATATAGDGFEDFYIVKERSVGGFVNLLGMESPGLTASLAVGEYVHELLYG